MNQAAVDKFVMFKNKDWRIVAFFGNGRFSERKSEHQLTHAVICIDYYY